MIEQNKEQSAKTYAPRKYHKIMILGVESWGIEHTNAGIKVQVLYHKEQCSWNLNVWSALQKIISLNNYNKQDFLKSVRNAKEPDKDKSVFIRQITSVILTQILEFIKKNCEN